MTLPASVIFVLQSVVGLLFLQSAWGKLGNLGSYLDAVAEYQVLPLKLSRVIGAALVLAELAICITHFLGVWLRIAVPLTLLLLLTFALVITWTLKRGRRVRCLCFGPQTQELVSPRALYRIAMLGFVEACLLAIVQATPSDRAWLVLSTPEILLCLVLAATVLVTGSWLLRLPDLRLPSMH
jgi:hypothetical protein